MSMFICINTSNRAVFSLTRMTDDPRTVHIKVKLVFVSFKPSDLMKKSVWLLLTWISGILNNTDKAKLIHEARKGALFLSLLCSTAVLKQRSFPRLSEVTHHQLSEGEKKLLHASLTDWTSWVSEFTSCHTQALYTLWTNLLTLRIFKNTTFRYTRPGLMAENCKRAHQADFTADSWPAFFQEHLSLLFLCSSSCLLLRLLCFRQCLVSSAETVCSSNMLTVIKNSSVLWVREAAAECRLCGRVSSCAEMLVLVWLVVSAMSQTVKSECNTSTGRSAGMKTSCG